VELVPEEVQQSEILELCKARRNLAGENVVGQIHRLEALQVPQLRSERARERIHLKKQSVHILKPSKISWNLAGESAIRGVETDKLGQVSNLRRDAAGISIVVAYVELAKRGEVSELRRDVSRELVAGDGEVLEVLPGTILGGDLTGEKVATQVEVAEEGH